VITAKIEITTRTAERIFIGDHIFINCGTRYAVSGDVERYIGRGVQIGSRVCFETVIPSCHQRSNS
jgi:hypothetical protein